MIVLAGAGYGKTTLVAQMCSRLKTDTVWYSLGSSDSDFVTFVSYLISGIKQYYHDFGRTTLKVIDSAQSIREKETILTFLLKEIEESITKDLIVVLDDLHFVQDNPEIRETLVFLIKHLPNQVHLVLISRKTPELNISSLIAKRGILLIDEKNLAFDTGEIQDFYKNIFHISLPINIIETIRDKTEGWVSGLILFQHSFQGESSKAIEDRLDKLQGTSTMIFTFLEENIFGFLPEEIKDFLLKTSILSRLDIAYCNRFLETNRSREILGELESKHLFTFPFDEQRMSWYYHHLFQDFLREKLTHEFGEQDIAQLHEQAGQAWEDTGEIEEALHHFLDAGLYEKACELLSPLGRKFIRGGQINLFLSFFNRIPDEFKKNEPWLHYTHGRALELHGKSREASRAYERAKNIFTTKGIPKGVGLSLNCLSSYYYTIGDFQKAEAMLKEIVNGMQAMPRLYANAMGNLIFVSSHLGKFDEADRYFSESANLFGEMIEGDLKAWIHIKNGFRYFTSGDLIQALNFGEEGLRMSESWANNDLLSYGYHLLSITNYFQGNHVKGLELALKGIQLNEERGFRGMNHVWHLINACFCTCAAGDMTRALEYGEQAVKASQEVESSWSIAWAYLSLQIVHQKTGNIKKAEGYARSAARLLDSLYLPGDEGVMKGSLASILLDKGQLEEVEDLLATAEDKLRGSKLNLTRVLLFFARYYWEKQEASRALKKLSSGLELSERNNYDHWIIQERHWIIPLLIDLYSKDRFKDYLNKLFPKFGPTAIEELNKLKKSKNSEIADTAESILTDQAVLPPAGLRVSCFGKFMLFRGDEEIPVEAWKSEKARMLFKYLVYHKSEGYIAKDILIELLWPEADPEKSRKRFNVALTSIRKILEPGLQRGASSTYLIRKGEGYRLNLGQEGYSDIEAFDAALYRAENEKDPDNAVEDYLQAETLYKGDLFQEDQYEEWCRDARSQYSERYLRVLRFLLLFFEKKGDLEKAVMYTRRYLEIDKYAENIYRTLMEIYHQTNNRAMVKKTYEEAKRLLENELECPLSKETEKLYTLLT